jgi:hypothetical protein
LRFEIRVTAIILAAMACGCGSSSAPSQPAIQQQSTGGLSSLPVVGQPPMPEHTSSIDEAVLTDPSALRLGKILEAIFSYFAINKGMPATLDDLKAVDSELITIAPSGQPYEYYPQGLPLPNSADKKLLVVADPVETRDGRRYCILASLLKPGAPLTGEVMYIPEVTYAAYRFSHPQ